MMPDGTYRVRCMTCSKSVSNAMPIDIIVRAWVVCPECIERDHNTTTDLRSGVPTWAELDAMYTRAINIAADLRAQLDAERAAHGKAGG